MSPIKCSVCSERRLRPESLAVKIAGRAISEFVALAIGDARPAVDTILKTAHAAPKRNRARVLEEIGERLDFLDAVGLGYLSLARSAATLSGGEAQRIRLATQIGSRLRGVLYVLDEPSIGLHARDNDQLIARSSVCAISATPCSSLSTTKKQFVAPITSSISAPALEMPADISSPSDNPPKLKRMPPRSPDTIFPERNALKFHRNVARPNGKALHILGATANNLKNIDVSLPLGLLTVVTGVSGSGKSTLVNDILYRAVAQKLYRSSERPGEHRAIEGIDQLDKIIEIDQAPIGRTPRSNPATYTGVFSPIRDLYAMLPESRERGYKPGRFSFNVKGGRCEACQGDGLRRIEMNFLPDVYVTCEVCRARRYNAETLAVRYKGKSISDILAMPIEEADPLLANIPQIHQKLATLVEVGLGYVRLGQSSTTLSGGEAQRIKLARELSKRQTGRTLYILDEPTTGLHFDDVRKLLDVLNRLVDLGNTVFVIEHHLDVIKQADWIIDLGPEGGAGGGRVVAQGTPEQVARVKKSYTGQALARMLKLSEKKSA